jgi:hypothetical protein
MIQPCYVIRAQTLQCWNECFVHRQGLGLAMIMVLAFPPSQSCSIPHCAVFVG